MQMIAACHHDNVKDVDTVICAIIEPLCRANWLDAMTVTCCMPARLNCWALGLTNIMILVSPGIIMQEVSPRMPVSQCLMSNYTSNLASLCRDYVHEVPLKVSTIGRGLLTS